MSWYQGTESGGWPTGQRSEGGKGAVPILVCAGLGLLIFIFVDFIKNFQELRHRISKGLTQGVFK